MPIFNDLSEKEQIEEIYYAATMFIANNYQYMSKDEREYYDQMMDYMYPLRGVKKKGPPIACKKKN
jgi:dsDNA-binding SOS-regulon protein